LPIEVMLGFMRRPRLVPLTTLVVLASIVSVVSGASPGSGAVAHPSPLVQRGTAITNQSDGVGTAIDRVDMVTSRLGYGLIANNIFDPTRWIYLVRTTDAGSSWTMQGALPYYAFHQSGGEEVPTIDFVNAQVGYVSLEGTVPGAIFITKNGGISWSKVLTPGVTPDFLATSSTFAVVTDICNHPHQESDFNLCPNRLSLYHVGATSPWRSVLIPRTSNIVNRDAQLFAIVSPNTFVVSAGDPGGGGQHSRLSLSVTNDAGITWRHLDDPCAGLGSNQLVTYSTTKWLLACFLGIGMNQGMGNLWRTDDAGVTWTRVQHGDAEATTLVPSGNQRILFGEVAGATGGIVYSVDGGSHWIRTSIAGLGGAPESLSTIGPTGAIDDVLGGLIYRTTDGRHWTTLPELPASTYRGMSICSARSGVKATFRWKPLKAAIGPSGIIYTNNGAKNCYLDAAPIVQPVDGAARTPVGPPAEMTYEQTDFVVLKAHGGRANTSYLLFPTNSYQPASTCAGEVATGLSIDFGSPSHFFVPFRSPTKVCTKFSTASVIEVLAGLSKHYTMN
jgi:photosystem II stability/assembly factor-like uncharacterized protein